MTGIYYPPCLNPRLSRLSESHFDNRVSVSDLWESPPHPICTINNNRFRNTRLLSSGRLFLSCWGGWRCNWILLIRSWIRGSDPLAAFVLLRSIRWWLSTCGTLNYKGTCILNGSHKRLVTFLPPLVDLKA